METKPPCQRVDSSVGYTILDDWLDLVEDVIQRTSLHPSREQAEKAHREANRRRLAEILERFDCLP